MADNPKIPREQFNKFYGEYHSGNPKYKWFRFGQAFFFEFSDQGMSHVVDSELFYRENDKEAFNLIIERYIQS